MNRNYIRYLQVVRHILLIFLTATIGTLTSNLLGQPGKKNENYNDWVVNFHFCAGKPIINKGNVLFDTRAHQLKADSRLAYGMNIYRNIFKGDYFVNLGIQRSIWQYEVNTIGRISTVNCPNISYQLGISKKLKFTHSCLDFVLNSQIYSSLKTQSIKYKSWFNGINSEILYTRVKKKYGFSIGIEHAYMPISKKHDGVFELFNDGYYSPVEIRFQAIGIKLGVSYFLNEQ